VDRAATKYALKLNTFIIYIKTLYYIAYFLNNVLQLHSGPRQYSQRYPFASTFRLQRIASTTRVRSAVWHERHVDLMGESKSIGEQTLHGSTMAHVQVIEDFELA
jgi:hypothetical protein